MNILTLKTIAYNPEYDKLYSPSHRDFAWDKGVIARACPRCNVDTCNPDCTCGIYGSPNPEALDEYAKFANSIYVLMNTYGWVDMWTGPKNVNNGNTIITRAWGTQVVGVVHVNGHNYPQRMITMLRATELFEVNAYPWLMVKQMIRTSWKAIPGLAVTDPYNEEALAPWK